MPRFKFYVVGFCLCCITVLQAQNETKDDVHLVQTFFRDAAASNTTYGEAVFGFSNYDAGNVLNLGVRAGFPIHRQFTVGGSLAFLNRDPDQGESDSGISDLRVVGIYHFLTNSPTEFSAGGFLTLPIGSEDLDQEEANFGVFGAVRHPVASQTVVTGTLSLDFLEGAPVGSGGWPAVLIGPDRETALLIGGGVVHQITRQVNFIGELNFRTEGDFGLLTGGVDYELESGGRLRGSLGIGLDDGAPDVTILLGFLHFFR